MKRFNVALGFMALATLAFAQGGGPGPRPGQGGPPQMPPDAPPILQKAMRMAMSLKFSGERVVEFRDRSDRRRYREYVLKDGPRIRVEYSDDAPQRGQIIVEDGDRRFHFRPDLNEIEVGPARGEELLGRISGFAKFAGERRMRVTVDNGGKVAGLDTSRVTFTDRRGNAVQRLWIHERTGLIAKRELYDEVGSVVGSFEFAKVDFSPRFRNEDFRIQRQGAKVVSTEDAAIRLMKANGFLPVVLNQEGYRLEGSRLIGSREKPALQLFYRTPRGPLSMIQLKGDVRLPMMERRGGDRVSVHRWKFKGREFVLLGPMPPEELARLAARVVEK